MVGCQVIVDWCAVVGCQVIVDWCAVVGCQVIVDWCAVVGCQVIVDWCAVVGCQVTVDWCAVVGCQVTVDWCAVVGCQVTVDWCAVVGCQVTHSKQGADPGLPDSQLHNTCMWWIVAQNIVSLYNCPCISVEPGHHLDSCPILGFSHLHLGQFGTLVDCWDFQELVSQGFLQMLWFPLIG